MGEEENDTSDSDEEDEREDLGLEDEDGAEADEEEEPVFEETTNNPLMASLSKETSEEKKAKKAELWFQKIGDIDSDSDLEEAELERAVSMVKEKGGTLRKKQEEIHESGYTSGSEDEDEDGDQKPRDKLP